MISVSQMLDLVDDATIFQRKAEKSVIDAMLVSRFAFSVSRCHSNFAKFVLNELFWDEIEIAFDFFRKELILYGDVHMIGEKNYPYLRLDICDVKKIMYFYLENNLEVWICDPGFNWCIEIQSKGIISYFESPFSAIIKHIYKKKNLY